MDIDGSSVEAIYLQVAAESDALGDAALIRNLRTLLGAKLVAYIVDAASTDTVADYIDGHTAVPHEVGDRLRSAYRVAELQHRLGATSSLIQAWFQGSNPRLGDLAPARVVVEKPDVEDRSLIAAAISLVSE